VEKSECSHVMTSSKHVYEVRPRKDKRGVDLISDALPFGGLWYGEPDAISNAVGSVKFYSRPASPSSLISSAMSSGLASLPLLGTNHFLD
jgi:hypothetical protein